MSEQDSIPLVPLLAHVRGTDYQQTVDQEDTLPQTGIQTHPNLNETSRHGTITRSFTQFTQWARNNKRLILSLGMSTGCLIGGIIVSKDSLSRMSQITEVQQAIDHLNTTCMSSVAALKSYSADFGEPISSLSQDEASFLAVIGAGRSALEEVSAAIASESRHGEELTIQNDRHENSIKELSENLNSISQAYENVSQASEREAASVASLALKLKSTLPGSQSESTLGKDLSEIRAMGEKIERARRVHSTTQGGSSTVMDRAAARPAMQARAFGASATAAHDP